MKDFVKLSVYICERGENMDQQIIQMLLERDDRAIQAMIDEYGNYCGVIANNILCNHEDSDECVNDTYLKAWNSIPPMVPDSLRAYLGKITRNLALNLYQKNHAKKRGNGNLEAIFEELEAIVEGKNNISDELDYKELMKHINMYLKDLPKEKRQIFVRRYWYADSITDIALNFGISKNKVSVTLSRVVKQLKLYLEERGYAI